jgi:hypothetical protein
MQQQQEKQRIQWEMLLALGVFVASIWAVMVPLFTHLDNKTDQRLVAIQQSVDAIHDEIKDFHGRLCAIEERNKCRCATDQ